ncbi:MAG: DUF1569 domain-containing protein [Gemmatimonadota bacterium]|nr:DUF1569 domain-containing protein [Gemmatimonadota bacterium]
MKTILDSSTRQQLLNRLDRVAPHSERKWGAMTAHRMVCHLGDQLRVALGDIPCKKRSNLLSRTLLKWMILYLPIPTPKGKIGTVPEMQSTPAVDWEKDIAACKKLIERLAAKNRHEQPADHPVFGSLSASQWGILAYLHLDHHLRQFGA